MLGEFGDGPALFLQGQCFAAVDGERDAGRTTIRGETQAFTHCGDRATVPSEVLGDVPIVPTGCNQLAYLLVDVAEPLFVPRRLTVDHAVERLQAAAQLRRDLFSW